MLYMTDGVEMSSSTGGGAGAAFKRYLSGGSAFVTDFKLTETFSSGTVALGPDFPSKIERVILSDHGGEVTCAKGSMLCMGVNVDLTPTPVTDFKAGLFGGEGFILQKLSAADPEAGAFITGTGALHKLPIAPGASLRISTGALVAFTSATLSFSAEMLPGVKNMLFSGEGLFVTRIKNESKEEGYVWVQGLESGKFVAEIGRRGGFGGGGGSGIPLGMMMGGAGGGGGGGGEGGEGGEGLAAGAGVGEAMEGGEDAVDADRKATTAIGGSEGAAAAADPNPFGDEGFEGDGGVTAGADGDETSFDMEGGGDGGGEGGGGEEETGGIMSMFSGLFDDDE